MRFSITLALILALAGCGEDSADYNKTAEYRVVGASLGGDERQSARTPAQEQQENFIAYRYNLGVQIPADAVEPLHARHVEECTSAGRETCQLINSWVERA